MSSSAFSEHAFIALGANLPGEAGDPAGTIRAVLPELQKLGSSELLVSSLYESDPKDCPPGSPRYINGVAALMPKPGETPESLLQKLLDLEKKFGRARSGIINEARTLDLDLLSFARETRHSKFLTLPHPRAFQRRFVLQPWIELVGEEWQLNGRSLAYWLSQNQDEKLIKIQAD